MVYPAATPIRSQDLPSDHSQWQTTVFRQAYRHLASAEEWAVLDTLSAGQLPGYVGLFWKRRDPTPTTEVNEFKDQFHDRVQWAATWFRWGNVDGPAWDIRGDVWIKYGEPDARGPIVARNERFAGPVAGPVVDFLGEQEVWQYFRENLRMQFQIDLGRMEHVPYIDLSLQEQPLGRYYDDRYDIHVSPVLYDPAPGVQHLDVALNAYPFRRVDGRYDLYVATSARMDRLARSTGYRKSELEYTVHVVAFATDLTEVWRDSVRVRRTLEGRHKGELIAHQWATELPSGLYIVGIEIAAASGRKHAAARRERWLVPYVESAELDLSPLIIAADVRDAEPAQGAFTRNRKTITPLPGGVVKKGQDVAFYHEVYNLRPDEWGTGQYRVEYTLHDLRNNDRRLLRSEDLIALEPDTYQSGRIPGDQLRKGEYILEVRTHDLVAGATKTALADFRVD